MQTLVKLGTTIAAIASSSLLSLVAMAANPTSAEKAIVTAPPQATPDPSPSGLSRLVRLGANGKLIYAPYTTQGDTIPDFSNCGYMGGGVRIPDMAVKLTLRPQAGNADDTKRLQAAIDQIAAMAPDRSGFRGALLLSKGAYRIEGSLRIKTSGIVLRGEGSGEGGTVLRATGNKPRVLIIVDGEAKSAVPDNDAVEVTDAYVPVGARSMTLTNASAFHVGDTVVLRRTGNEAWIRELGMDDMPIKRSGTRNWKSFDIDSDRVVTAVKGNRITVDAPICCAMEQRWGGGEVVKYQDGRIEQVGIENLRGESAFDPTVKKGEGTKAYPADENHATDVISFGDVKNGWARRIVATHFVHGVAKMERNAKWITVQDSEALSPVSIITGGRRYPFNIMGQLCLVLRCYSDEGRHAFVMNGSHQAGPAAFVMCKSEHDHADSGPHQRWSTGTLWDNVTGVMHTQDRENMGSGHGWAGANDVYWNCAGSITIQQPPTAQNFAIGFVGKKDREAFPQLKHPEGWYDSFGKHVQPASLYMQQLKDRLGQQAVDNIAAGATAGAETKK